MKKNTKTKKTSAIAKKATYKTNTTAFTKRADALEKKIIALAKRADALAKKETTKASKKAPYIDQYSVIRTNSAGCWFGKIVNEYGDKIELTDARRLWRWHAKEGISLSGVARVGIVHATSRIEAACESVWLAPIEIIKATTESINSIINAPSATPSA